MGSKKIMAFGKQEIYNDDIISYKESVDMLLNDLQHSGLKNLTKQSLMNALTTEMSIGRAVRFELLKLFGR